MIDPMQAIMKIAASGLDAQSKRMRVVSENLANAQSTGKTAGADPYTRKIISFDAVLDEATNANLVKADRIEPQRTAYRIEHDPDNPAADANGYVKLPNVNMLVELADMREANRSYEANLQVMKQTREMISMTIDLLRSSQ